MVEQRFDRMTASRARKSKKLRKVFDDLISEHSRMMLDRSAANLKKGLASAPIANPKKRGRLGH
jgi:hypothetical protein